MENKNQNALANVFSSIVQQAAALPKETGATGVYEARIKNASDIVLIIVDTSGSMDGQPIRVVKNTLDDVVAQCVVPPRLMEFNSVAKFVDFADDIGETGGGTALHRALALAQSLKPKHTIIMTDGEPDDEDEALREADHLTGTIDVIFCGSDTDKDAIDFCKKLSRVGMGRTSVVDLHKQNSRLALTMQTRQLLALPAPSSV